MSWDDLYKQVETGSVVGIDGGNYRVQVSAVRPLAKSRMLFVDLEVTAGPLTGKTTSVNLYIPKAGDRGAGFHFTKKMRGFGDMSAVFAAMSAADPDGSNIEPALEILAKGLIGRTVDAELTLRGEDAGQYAGTNELVSTKPVDGAPTPVSPGPSEVPAPAPAVAAAAPGPVAPDPGF